MEPGSDLNAFDSPERRLSQREDASDQADKEERVTPHHLEQGSHDGGHESPGTPDSSLDWEYLHPDDFHEGSSGQRTPIRSAHPLFDSAVHDTSPLLPPRSQGGITAAEEEEENFDRAAVSSPNSVRSLNADGLVSEPLSDTESNYTNDLMAAGEPEDMGSPMASSLEGPAALERVLSDEEGAAADNKIDLETGSDAPTAADLPPLGLAARACMVTADRLASAMASVTRQLRAVSALSEHAARGAWVALVDLVASLQSELARVMVIPRGLGAAPLLASIRCSIQRGREQILQSASHASSALCSYSAVTDDVKPLLKRRVGTARRILVEHWPALALAAGCAAVSAALYRSISLNTKLAARLSQREGELAELVSRIVALQRSVTRQHSARGLPVIAHASSACATSWHHHHHHHHTTTTFGMV